MRQKRSPPKSVDKRLIAERMDARTHAHTHTGFKVLESMPDTAQEQKLNEMFTGF